MRDGTPEPLIYYLHAAALAHHQLISAAGATSDNAISNHLDEATQHDLAQLTHWDLAEASCQRLTDMLRGIDLWRTHSYRRELPEPPVIWRKGKVKLLDYGKTSSSTPILVIPSLINRAYILDLMEDASFIRRLAKQNLRPVLIDWGEGSDLDSPQTISDYILDILIPTFEFLEASTKRKPALLGYCVGGTLALGMAAHLKDRVSRLATIGGPWDFSQLKGVSQGLKTQAEQMGTDKLRASLSAMGYHFGAVPSIVFQQLFALLSPMQAVQKFSTFEAMDQETPQSQKFAAVEDWLADGVSVPAPATETILIDWYVENQTAKGQWTIKDTPVNPRSITCPTLIVTGARDHIVPPEMSTGLLTQIPNAHHHSVNMGHVGMIVGSQAHALVADRVSQFFYP